MSDFPFVVTEEQDGSLKIEWDKSHPVTSVFNSWTEKDFRDMLERAARKVIERHEQSGRVA